MPRIERLNSRCETKKPLAGGQLRESVKLRAHDATSVANITASRKSQISNLKSPMTTDK